MMDSSTSQLYYSSTARIYFYPDHSKYRTIFQPEEDSSYLPLAVLFFSKKFKWNTEDDTFLLAHCLLYYWVPTDTIYSRFH